MVISRRGCGAPEVDRFGVPAHEREESGWRITAGKMKKSHEQGSHFIKHFTYVTCFRQTRTFYAYDPLMGVFPHSLAQLRPGEGEPLAQGRRGGAGRGIPTGPQRTAPGPHLVPPAPSPAGPPAVVGRG